MRTPPLLVAPKILMIDSVILNVPARLRLKTKREQPNHLYFTLHVMSFDLICWFLFFGVEYSWANTFLLFNGSAGGRHMTEPQYIPLTAHHVDWGLCCGSIAEHVYYGTFIRIVLSAWTMDDPDLIWLQTFFLQNINRWLYTSIYWIKRKEYFIRYFEFHLL